MAPDRIEKGKEEDDMSVDIGISESNEDSIVKILKHPCGR